MKLTDHEKDILDGREGPAVQIALSSLVDMGEAFGAEELIAVSQAHIDAAVYMVDAQIEFVERLADLGARLSIPSSLNAASIDLKNPQALRVPETLLEKCRRLEKAYLKMGATPTWTCAPYQQGLMPRFGERIAWGESNAIVFANSVIGARTIRYGDLMDVCAAIVGKALLDPGKVADRKAQALYSTGSRRYPTGQVPAGEARKAHQLDPARSPVGAGGYQDHVGPGNPCREIHRQCEIRRPVLRVDEFSLGD